MQCAGTNLMWALSKRDRTTYDLASCRNTKVTITVSRGKFQNLHVQRAVFHVINYMGQTLSKEIFSGVNLPNFQQIRQSSGTFPSSSTVQLASLQNLR